MVFRFLIIVCAFPVWGGAGLPCPHLCVSSGTWLVSFSFMRDSVIPSINFTLYSHVSSIGFSIYFLFQYVQLFHWVLSFLWVYVVIFHHQLFSARFPYWHSDPSCFFRYYSHFHWHGDHFHNYLYYFNPLQICHNNIPKIVSPNCLHPLSYQWGLLTSHPISDSASNNTRSYCSYIHHS